MGKCIFLFHFKYSILTTFKGLNPELFWANRDELLKADRSGLLSLVEKLVSSEKMSARKGGGLVPPTPVERVFGRLLLSTIADVPDEGQPGSPDYLVLSLSDGQEQMSTESRLYLPVISGKKGQTEFLNSILPKSMVFIRSRLALSRNVCVACESGKDLSVGVVVAALQLYFTDEGVPIQMSSEGVKPNSRKPINFFR